MVGYKCTLYKTKLEIRFLSLSEIERHREHNMHSMLGKKKKKKEASKLTLEGKKNRGRVCTSGLTERKRDEKGKSH